MRNSSTKPPAVYVMRRLDAFGGKRYERGEVLPPDVWAGLPWRKRSVLEASGWVSAWPPATEVSREHG